MRLHLARTGLRFSNEKRLAVPGNWQLHPPTILQQILADMYQHDTFGSECRSVFGQRKVVKMPACDGLVTGAFGQEKVGAAGKTDDRVAPGRIAGERDKLVAELDSIAEAWRVLGMGHGQRGDCRRLQTASLAGAQGLVPKAKAKLGAGQLTIACGC